MVARWPTAFDGRTLTFSDGGAHDLTDLPGVTPGRLNRLANETPEDRQALIDAAIAWLQARLDNRVLIADLPLDDPDRTINPDSPRRFWSDADGNPVAASPTHITERTVVATLAWNGETLVPGVRNP